MKTSRILVVLGIVSAATWSSVALAQGSGSSANESQGSGSSASESQGSGSSSSMRGSQGAQGEEAGEQGATGRSAGQETRQWQGAQGQGAQDQGGTAMNQGESQETHHRAGNHANAGEQNGMKSVVGTVESMSGDKLSLRNRLHQTHEFTIGHDTKFTRHGQAISRDEVGSGDEVRAAFRKENGTRHATAIQVLRTGSQQGNEGSQSQGSGSSQGSSSMEGGSSMQGGSSSHGGSSSQHGMESSGQGSGSSQGGQQQ